jgi:hypothetical protein
MRTHPNVIGYPADCLSGPNRAVTRRARHAGVPSIGKRAKPSPDHYTREIEMIHVLHRRFRFDTVSIP